MSRPLLLLLLVPLVLAACGSSSESGATTPTTTPAADFVKAGNQVCIASDKRIFKIGRLGRDPNGWARTASAARQAVREMRAVQPPAAKRTRFNQMVRYASAVALSIQEIHDALVTKDYDTAAAGQFAAAQLSDKVHQAARGLGLTFCQQTLTNWPA